MRRPHFFQCFRLSAAHRYPVLPWASSTLSKCPRSFDRGIHAACRGHSELKSGCVECEVRHRSTSRALARFLPRWPDQVEKNCCRMPIGLQDRGLQDVRERFDGCALPADLTHHSDGRVGIFRVRIWCEQQVPFHSNCVPLRPARVPWSQNNFPPEARATNRNGATLIAAE